MDNNLPGGAGPAGLRNMRSQDFVEAPPMKQQMAPGNAEGYEQVIQEKDNTITQLRETVEILELKIKKLEQLVKLKDSKISNLTNKLNSMGIM